MARVLEVTYETAAGLRDDVKQQLAHGGLAAAVEGGQALPPFAPLALRLRVLAPDGGEDRVIELAGRLTSAAPDSLCVALDDASRAQLPEAMAALDDDARAAGWRTAALLDEPDAPPDEPDAPAAAPDDGPARAKSAALPLDRRLAVMSVSEKVQLALHGDRDARMLLLRERAGVVQASLTRNPKATLDELTALARSPQLAPDGAEALARHPSHGDAPQIAHALCRNPRTPINIAVTLVDRLNPSDLRAIAKGLGVRPQVAQAARKRLVDR